MFGGEKCPVLVHRYPQSCEFFCTHSPIVPNGLPGYTSFDQEVPL